MARHPERSEAPSVEAALVALGVAPGTPAALAPAELDAGALGVTPSGVGPVSLAIVDADRADLREALGALAPRLLGGALVVVRVRARGDGVLGALRGPRALEDVVEPLLTLPLSGVGVVEVRGLFGPTLAWARLTPDAPAWSDAAPSPRG